MEIKLHLSGYDIVYNGITIYFGIMPKATDEEKMKSAEEKMKEIETVGIDEWVKGMGLPKEPKPTIEDRIFELETENAEIIANTEYNACLLELQNQ